MEMTYTFFGLLDNTARGCLRTGDRVMFGWQPHGVICAGVELSSAKH